MPLKTPFGPDRDTYYMQQALKLARKAYGEDEVPVGALVVTAQGVIIGRGYNKVEQRCTQAAHAEVLALAQAGKKIGDWRLSGCWLYVTLEPCAVCLHLIRLSRLEGIVFGAPSPLFGSCLDKDSSRGLYKKDILIMANVGAEESAQLLRQFFQQKRVKCG